MVGFATNSAAVYHPRNHPAGMANAAAVRKPAATRRRESSTYITRTPLRASSTVPFATSNGDGKTFVWLHCTEKCHNIRNMLAVKSGHKYFSHFMGWDNAFISCVPSRSVRKYHRVTPGSALS